jgi:predicted GNAT superfamily acetyltransferase
MPNLYGVTTSPLHRDIPTDRLVAEWYLDTPRVNGAISDHPQPPLSPTVTVELPTSLEVWKKSDPAQLMQLQLRIREEFKSWFAQGFEAYGVLSTEKGSAYVLRPVTDATQQGKKA